MNSTYTVQRKNFAILFVIIQRELTAVVVANSLATLWLIKQRMLLLFCPLSTTICATYTAAKQRTFGELSLAAGSGFGNTLPLIRTSLDTCEPINLKKSNSCRTHWYTDAHQHVHARLHTVHIQIEGIIKIVSRTLCRCVPNCRTAAPKLVWQARHDVDADDGDSYSGSHITQMSFAVAASQVASCSRRRLLRWDERT